MSSRCRSCCYCGLGLLPLTFSVGMVLTFILTYILAVADNHVYPYLPSISDTGGRKPESNYFSVLLSVCSFVGFLVVCVRFVQYRHISEYNEEEHAKLRFLNKIALLVGVVAALGAIVVAGFQDRGRSFTGHYVGAIAVFGGCIIYCWINTYMSFRMVSCGIYTRRLCFIRLFFVSMATISLTVFLVFFYKSASVYTMKRHELYTPERRGYSWHVASSSGEWLCMAFLMLYFLSFTNEFDNIRLDFSVRRNDLTILPFQTSTDEGQPLVYA